MTVENIKQALQKFGGEGQGQISDAWGPKLKPETGEINSHWGEQLVGPELDMLQPKTRSSTLGDPTLTFSQQQRRTNEHFQKHTRN